MDVILTLEGRQSGCTIKVSAEERILPGVCGADGRVAIMCLIEVRTSTFDYAYKFLSTFVCLWTVRKTPPCSKHN